MTVNTRATTRWLRCRDCDAICDAVEDDLTCWNCERDDLRPIKLSRNTCDKCGRCYWAPEGLARCPFYNEEDHNGAHGYYPPMLPALYLLRMNGYDYVEKVERIVKKKGRR